MSTTTLEDIKEAEVNSQGKGKIIPFFPKVNNPESIGSTGQISYHDHTATATKLFPSESYTDDEYEFLAIPKQLQEPKQRSQLALKVIRTHYSKELIINLEWLAVNHEPNNPTSIPYISALLSLMKEYFDNFFHDPFSSFLIALYDGLTHNNEYLNLENTSYRKLFDFVKALNNQELDYKRIDKYIFKLEELGINITPY